jgi:hypothetical protein
MAEATIRRGRAMAEHSPGPWTIDRTTLSIVRLLITPEDVTAWHISSERTTIAYVPSDYNPREQKANARLIAAAPALLAACRAVLSSPRHGDTPSDEAIEMVRAAIARATQPDA